MGAALERLQAVQRVIRHPLNIGRDEDNWLVEYGVNTMSDIEDDSLNGVLENATLSESEYILSSKKPLADHSDVKHIVGKSLTLHVLGNIYRYIGFV